MEKMKTAGISQIHVGASSRSRLPSVRTKKVLAGILLGGQAVGIAGILALHGGTSALSPVGIDSSRWLLILVTAFVTAYIDACVGGGHGTLLTPILILLGFPAKMVVPAILISEIGIGILATILHHRAGNLRMARREADGHVFLVLAGCSVLGSILAVTMAVKLSPRWVSLYIGSMIIAIGLLLMKKPVSAPQLSMKKIMILGTVAAFNKGISGGGYGPLLTSGQILSGVREKGAVSITPPARGLTGLISVILYLMTQGTLDIALVLPLVLGSLLAVVVAVVTVTKIDVGVLRKGITGTTLALGVLLICNAFRST